MLGILMQADRRLADQTVDGIARDLGMKSDNVARVLDGLEDRGVVQYGTDATLEVDVWIANNETAEQLDPSAED